MATETLNPLLAGAFLTKVVGVTFKNRDGSDRQNSLRHAQVHGIEYMVLEREPRNEYDRNAIKVCFLSRDRHVHIGYIGNTKQEGDRAGLASRLAPLMDAGYKFSVRPAYYQGGADGESLGLTISIQCIGREG